MPDRTFTEHSARLVRAAVAYLLAANGLTWAQERIPELIPPSVPGHGRSHLDPTDVGAALDLKLGAVVSVDFLTSAHAGFDVFEVAATSFPTNGTSFLVMSTGNTSSALLPNNEGNLSTELDGLNTEQGQDMVQIVLVLQPPAGATCLAFDFAYYSEEFPEWVGSQFNDAFVAEIGQSNFEIVDDQVIAPHNFAFDEEGNVISINTLFGVTAENAAGTTYDAGTLKLTAWTPLEGFGGTVGRCSDNPEQVCSSDASCAGYCVPQVTVTLSIMDLGDPIFDSTAFIDNFRWISGVACEPGADVDTDGDALLDRWETDGIDLDGDGIIDLDLPAMGADPRHKDIFIEIDYMVMTEDSDRCKFSGARCSGDEFCAPPDYCLMNHSHQPTAAALKSVVEAFHNAPVPNPDRTNGITLHIDAGRKRGYMKPRFHPDGSLDEREGAGEFWGSMSKSDSLDHKTILGAGAVAGTYKWTEFDFIKNGSIAAGTPQRFSTERRGVFHYGVFAHLAAFTCCAPGCALLCPNSGIAREIPSSDFIISPAMYPKTGNVGSDQQQAGTLMHELGHNLGLQHGGDDPNPWKPNYLSVMNYFFQSNGLRLGGLDGLVDYSRFVLDPLDESDLDEPDGLAGVKGGDVAVGYGTAFACDCATGLAKMVDDINVGIDWNCNQPLGVPGSDLDVEADLDCSGTLDVLQNLKTDWELIVFDGGEVGGLGETIELPVQTESIELTYEEDQKIPTDLRVYVCGPGFVQRTAGGSDVYLYTIANTGSDNDVYLISSSATQDWADTSVLPDTLVLSAGTSTEFLIPIQIPPGVPGGATDEIVITATSTANPRLSDSAETTTVVLAVTPTVSKGPMIVLVLLVLAGIAIKFGRRRSASA